MNNKKLETNSIPIPPQLAGLLKQTLGKTGNGFDEGAFLQQLHYWTLNPQTTGWIIDGVKWIYNSLKSWQEQFPWMSEYGLRKAIANLKKLGLIQTAQHWITSYKRVMFYQIDYEKLNAFAKDLCDLVTPRPVSRDRIDVRSGRIANTETSPETSFPEQQTDIVSEIAVEASDFVKLPEHKADFKEKPIDFEASNVSTPSSGKNSGVKALEFPELVDAVAQAISLPSGSSLPASIKGAIARFPDRVQAAISFLQHQQQKRQIQNPMGYFYQTLVSGWDLSIPQTSAYIIPADFSKWFDWAKMQGWVIAATTINGVHHTLHSQQGWIPTKQVMQHYPQPISLESLSKT